jgi:hypothetical protein
MLPVVTFNLQGLTYTNDSFRRTPSSRLTAGGSSLPSYGAFRPNNATPFHNPRHGSSPSNSSFAAPGPTSHPSAEFPELLPELSSAPSYRPPQPTYGPSGGRPSKENCGRYFWLVVVLVQVVLIIYRSNTLEKYIDLESTANRAAKEGSTLSEEREKSEHERAKMKLDREEWEKVPDDRVPPGAHWKPIWPAYDCRAYGKREYWGVLLDIPEGWSAMDACMNTPAEIEGVTVRRPDRCAFVSESPGIHGYWMVDRNQEDCKPWHKDIRDTVSQRLSSTYTKAMLTYHRDAQTTDRVSLESRQRSKAYSTRKSKTGG